MTVRILAALACVVLPASAWAQSAHHADFSGLKMGADADYRWHDGDYRVTTLGADLDRKKGGFGYRGRLGLDAQFGRAVVGAEAGFGGGGGKLKLENTVGSYKLEPGLTWDVSSRVGVLALPNALLYGRAGYSWLRVKEKTEFVANLKDVKDRYTEGGLLYGVGLEAAVSEGAFLRAEYSRVKYNDDFSSSKAQVGFSFGF
ncbi:outer membrane beta-barrel protein [Caulobacter soli]|uniref:outer membrane beta-barrel protein n=1 Tax=Caulobacter soli TaxID=2708539 RepID=UPI0013EDE283|nr:outer membrane beta-barrel protein [Caulobacter soli]